MFRFQRKWLSSLLSVEGEDFLCYPCETADNLPASQQICRYCSPKGEGNMAFQDVCSIAVHTHSCFMKINESEGLGPCTARNNQCLWFHHTPPHPDSFEALPHPRKGPHDHAWLLCRYQVAILMRKYYHISDSTGEGDCHMLHRLYCPVCNRNDYKPYGRRERDEGHKV